MSAVVRPGNCVALPVATARPSTPTFNSMMLVTPLAEHWATSEALMRREAFDTSGCCAPTPPQNSLTPPPVPVDSTIGRLHFGFFLTNCSDTHVVRWDWRRERKECIR